MAYVFVLNVEVCIVLGAPQGISGKQNCVSGINNPSIENFINRPTVDFR